MARHAGAPRQKGRGVVSSAVASRHWKAPPRLEPASSPPRRGFDPGIVVSRPGCCRPEVRSREMHRIGSQTRYRSYRPHKRRPLALAHSPRSPATAGRRRVAFFYCERRSTLRFIMVRCALGSFLDPFCSPGCPYYMGQLSYSPAVPKRNPLPSISARRWCW
jgi:hypothetical protein